MERRSGSAIPAEWFTFVRGQRPQSPADVARRYVAVVVGIVHDDLLAHSVVRNRQIDCQRSGGSPSRSKADPGTVRSNGNL
jgi:hypothetical protein